MEGQANHKRPPGVCPINYFTDGLIEQLTPERFRSCICLVDNRSKLDIYPERMAAYRMAMDLSDSKISGDLESLAAAIRAERKSDPKALGATRRLLDRELEKDGFRDTSQLCRWVYDLDQDLGLAMLGLPGLETIVFHAQSQSQVLRELIVERGLIPAAIILSGSPEMLDQVHKDEWIKNLLAVIKSARERSLPLLGICFGMQILGYQAFGVMPTYHCVPDGVTHEVHWRSKRRLTVTPGQNRMVYGTSRIRAFAKFAHPIIQGVGELEALEAHSMGFELGSGSSLPHSCVQAISRRRFVSIGRHGQVRFTVDQKIIEVIALGQFVVATQPHPEMTANLLLGLSYLPATIKLLRDEEGQGMKIIRWDLKAHGRVSKRSAGAQLGRNFLYRVMAPNWIERAEKDKLIDNVTAMAMLQRIGVIHSV